jgi:hypothetical protein
MRFGNRGARSLVAWRKAYRPTIQRLEDRQLLAGNAIDLANIAGTNVGTPSQVGPYGVEEVSLQGGLQAGSQVADVGNVAGTGFDDFLVTSPSPANGSSAVVQLILGSQQVSSGAVTPTDWRGLNTQQRVGNLALLGNTNQTNPINGQPGFNYAGITFTTNQPNGLVGATVAGIGDLNGDGFDDFLIGAPNADGGVGRVYLVYGGPELATLAAQGATINLDTTTRISVVAFVNNIGTPTTTLNALTGTSVGAVGNFLGDGRQDIVIGAPDASYNGTASGAVYVIPGGAIPSKNLGVGLQTVNLQAVGQTGGIGGVLFTGAAIGTQAGWSVASAGNVDGSTAAGAGVNDLLIGAPNHANTNVNLAGTAYLVYGSSALPSLQTLSNGVRSISLAVVGASTSNTPSTTNIPGASFTGTANPSTASNGDETGWSVSSAGDFNGDGFGDFMIGSPGYNSNTGEVTLIYGRSATSTAGRILGPFKLNNPSLTPPPGATAPSFVQFVGTNPADQAGYSISVVGKISASGFNNILIGSPGFFNNTGIVYLIPGQANLTGVQNLANAKSAPIDATLITNSASGNTAARLGQSISGKLTATTQTVTADADLIADFIIGSPGFQLPTVAPTNSGGVFILEGAFVPLTIPPVTPPVNIPVQIGVGSPFAPFIIPLSSPTIQVWVFSTTAVTPPFDPFADIDTSTITVNGTAIPAADVTITQTTDLNGDGIPEAILSFPTKDITLTTGTQTFTITGKTLSTAPNANETWGGSATITVTGPTTGSSLPPTLPGPPSSQVFVPPLGGAFAPTVQALSHLTYRPLPVRVAYQQYLPNRAYLTRELLYFDPKAVPGRNRTQSSEFGAHGVFTLNRKVFDRSRFHAGKAYRFVHPVPVIPPYLQVEGSVSKPKKG